MNDIKYSLLVCDYLVPKYAIATVISKALHFTVGRISTQYFFVEVRSWNLDIILSNIICKLHAKLNFGIFCYSLRWLENVCKFSSCVKKQKQINYEQCSMRWRDLGSVESASRKVFLKTWRIIVNCQNVLQHLAEINRITTWSFCYNALVSIFLKL